MIISPMFSFLDLEELKVVRLDVWSSCRGFTVITQIYLIVVRAKKINYYTGLQV